MRRVLFLAVLGAAALYAALAGNDVHWGGFLSTTYAEAALGAVSVSRRLTAT